MKPIKFDWQNTTYAEDQDDYISLPAYRCNDEYGRTVFCWKMTWRERIKVLFTGKVWQQTLTFNRPLQPVKLDADSPALSEIHPEKYETAEQS